MNPPETTNHFRDAWATPLADPKRSGHPASVFNRLTVSMLVLSFILSPLNLAFAQETTTVDQTSTNTTTTTDSTAPSGTTVDTSALDAALQQTTSDQSQTSGGTTAPAATALDQTTSQPTTDTSASTQSQTTTTPAPTAPITQSSPQPLVVQGAPSVTNPTFTYQTIAPKVDKTSGALAETLQLTIPPGRNGLQPDLALVYNSQRLEEKPLGYGWSVNIPYIERINRQGTNNLYSEDYFNSSLSGELASTSVSGQYAPKVEDGSFLKYTLSATSTGGQWVVYDKKGTKYTFGTSTATRLDDPNNSTHVYRWMLEEVRDTNNNFIRYEYFKDNGQIYPSKIYYTGSGSTDGVFTIQFNRESRGDVVTSYATAFLFRTNYRINQILASFNGTWVHKYDLAYTTGANGMRSLLASITESGQDESGTNTASLPPVAFQYANDPIACPNPPGQVHGDALLQVFPGARKPPYGNLSVVRDRGLFRCKSRLSVQ
jgi:hypothetical protein